MHVLIYVVVAPRLDEDGEAKDDELMSFVDKYICPILREKPHPKLNSLVKEV